MMSSERWGVDIEGLAALRFRLKVPLCEGGFRGILLMVARGRTSSLQAADKRNESI
jgi:hypothetical protein